MVNKTKDALRLRIKITLVIDLIKLLTSAKVMDKK